MLRYLSAGATLPERLRSYGIRLIFFYNTSLRYMDPFMNPLEHTEHDEDDEWFLQFVIPEEVIIRRYPSQRGGYYRRFESPNVIDLVRVRRQLAKRKQGGNGNTAA